MKMKESQQKLAVKEQRTDGKSARCCIFRQGMLAPLPLRSSETQK